MNKDSKPGFAGLSGNGLLALVALVAGTLYLRSVPLETTRPAVGDLVVQQHFGGQDVNARLWQDPFTAVARALEQSPKKTESQLKTDKPKPHSAAALADEIKDHRNDRKKVDVFAVMLYGGPQAEAVESRRRTRYAVLAALGASRFEPMDSEHLGYFHPSGPHSQIPRAVPYEWFGIAPDASPRNADAEGRSVLVMWLDAGAFANKPLAAWKALADQVWPAPGTTLVWRVLGPAGSDGLKAMVDEAAPLDAKEVPRPEAVRLRFFSATATVPDEEILKDKPVPKKSADLTSFFEEKGVEFVRTIGDDEKLADSLIGELQRRGLRASTLDASPGRSESDVRHEVCDPHVASTAGAPSHIAIIAEWDTLYGRSLRRNFRASLDHSGFCVTKFGYLRGLDGQIPVNPNYKADQPDAVRQESADKPNVRLNDGTFVERAEGQSQYDYLRRIAAQVRALDSELRRTQPDRKGVRAIGVLGNDVHDKLLVLKALEPEFPNAMFFTTDLDQRLIHPREQIVSRNLIVASNFGLQLFESLQAGTPRFRDSYQTSIFLATRLALEDARRTPIETGHAASPSASTAARTAASEPTRIALWFTKPRIFEIGRTEAFDFSDGQSSPGDLATRSSVCRGPDWIQCADIHPPGSPMFPSPGFWPLFGVFNLVIAALWLPVLVACGIARQRAGGMPARTPRRQRRARSWPMWVLLLLALHGVLPALLAPLWPAFAAWLTRDGKPIVAFEGISLWPTEAIRLFTMLLCIYLVCIGWVSLKRNQLEIALQLKVEIPRRRMIEK